MRQAKIHQIVADAARRFVTEEKDPATRHETYSSLLILLVRENLSNEAFSLVTQNSTGAAALETAIALADALTPLAGVVPLGTRERESAGDGA